MHTFSETGAGVPAFLAKLWRLVEDPETNNLIYWSKDGRSFIIQNQAQFARELLPLNYKHNNMASFIRQLNMYGFHKITSIDNGGLKFDRDEMEFTHPCFKRGCPYLLEHIKRKIANAKQHQQLIDDKAGIKVESVSKVLNEVKAMRGRQDSLDSRFSVMKQENEALWREIASLRQKHIKQQQIVNKLIQFLVTIVQPSRNMSGVKRTNQLMINDAPQSSKSRKASESESGPVISELTEELLEEVGYPDETEEDLLSGPPSPHMTVSSGIEQTQLESLSPSSNIERPNSTLSISSQFYEQQSNQSVEDAKVMNMSNTNSSGSIYDNNQQLVYHIREIPENSEISNEPVQYVEENILTTPLVKQEMARNEQAFQQKQQLQSQLKQNPSMCIRQFEHRNTRKRKHARESPVVEYVSTLANVNDPISIKTEKNDLDPLLFLETSSPANSYNLSPRIDTALISPNSNTSTSSGGADNNNSNRNRSTSYLNQLQKKTISCNQNEAILPDNHCSSSMYEGDFLNTDMPADLFEDSPMSCDINLASSSLQDRQTPIPSTSVTNESTTNGSATKKNLDNSTKKNEITQNTSSDGKHSSMSIVKLNTTQKSDEEIMKLHSHDEIHNHLEGVQDDLENLKDLLKGESYSFDSNTLSGNGNLSSNRIHVSNAGETDFWTKLFGDSDILEPYGLSLSNELTENTGNKSGNELTIYQPYGFNDLSEILNINQKDAELDRTNVPSDSDNSGLSSVLNTPRPESGKNQF